MPIKSITTTPAPGFLIQVCAACGAEHKISFGRGAQKTKKGPFVLQVGSTLEVAVDGGAPQTVAFAAGDFPDFGAVATSQLITKLATALVGIVAEDDAGGCLIESQSTSPQSKIEITGGTARAALGFPTNGGMEPNPGRPVLGVSSGSVGSRIQDKNIIALRRCSDCGANECLVRTFDVSPAEYNGTHFAEHRRAVNSLAQHFKAQGWSHPDVASEHATETRGPPDMDPSFPPGPSAPPLPRPRPEPSTRGGAP